MPSTDPKAAALDELAALVAAREDLERRITAGVAKAREATATWPEITRALTPPGAEKPLQRPNVQRKYQPLLREERVVTVREPE